MVLSFKNSPIKRSHKILAGIFCLLYIGIQIFQWYVLTAYPGPKNPEEELLQGASAIHLYRAILLLLSFFPLLYVYTVILLQEFRSRKLWFTLAFIGFLAFCFLEIGIRSVEFFYIQLQLPLTYTSAVSQEIKSSILEKASAFRSVQLALYFPLMLSQALSSLILAVNYPVSKKINILVNIAFGFNAFRLFGRIASMLFNIHLFDSFSGVLYLPFVIFIYGMLTTWLFLHQVNGNIRVSDFEKME